MPVRSHIGGIVGNVLINVVPSVVTFSALGPVASVLSRVADVFPIRHMTVGLVASFGSGPRDGVQVGELVVMPAWTAGGLLSAPRRFRWEPRRR
jgi:hypothetical protein